MTSKFWVWDSALTTFQMRRGRPFLLQVSPMHGSVRLLPLVISESTGVVVQISDVPLVQTR